MYIYIYINIYTYCRPELNASEIAVDFQWHFPMDFQGFSPEGFHMSVVWSKGLSLSQWSLLEMCNGCSAIFPNGISLV